MGNKYHNMTGEEIQSNEDLFIENKPKGLSWLDVFWIVFFFLACFSAGYIVGSNGKEKVDKINKILKSKVNYLESKLWNQKK